MREDQISLQLYTVREETSRDMPDTLRRISEIGYPAVEFAGYGGLSPRDLRKVLDDLGLSASGAHVPLESWERDPETVIADMHTLNCAHAIVPIAPPERRGDEASVASLAESLNRWGRWTPSLCIWSWISTGFATVALTLRRCFVTSQTTSRSST